MVYIGLLNLELLEQARDQTQMINLLELADSLATIARLGTTAHGLHHWQVELGRPVGRTTVTGFRATEEAEVFGVVEAGGLHCE